MIEEEIKTILLSVLQYYDQYLVLKYLPVSLPDPNVFRTTTRERTFEKKKFNEFKRRSFYDMQVECRLEKREKKRISNAIFSVEHRGRADQVPWRGHPGWTVPCPLYAGKNDSE